MIAESIGLDSQDPLILARLAMRVMTSRLLQATQSDPPHLVDVRVLNDQGIGIWHTLEIDNELTEGELSGWDVKWHKYYTFQWPQLVELNINSRNYQRASQDEWQRRIHDTNLRADERRIVKQSKGIYWRGR